MSRLNILVVGASIAGPTTAYWLSRAGHHVTIIERFPSLRTAGQNVDIRSVGVTVMRKMEGMEAAVREKTIALEGIEFVDTHDNVFATIRASGNPDAQTLVSEYEISRGDLSRVLYDLTKDDENIEYVFGEQVASIQQSSNEKGPVTVEFVNGLPSAQFDLVVACDGSTSRTRAIGLQCSVKDYTNPLNSWMALLTLNKNLCEGSRMARTYSAQGGRFIAMDSSAPGKTFVALGGICTRDDKGDMAMDAFRAAQKAGDEALKSHIIDFFAGSGWIIDDILEGMKSNADDFYAYELGQVKLPVLHKDRFVLVGDAGYAPGPTGGGTSLALAGSYVLAGEIARHRGNLKAGLNAYEQRMRPIVEDLQKVPLGVPGVMAPQTAWGLWFRNMVLAVVSWTRIIEWGHRLLGSSSFQGGDKFGLPDYDFVS